MTRKSQMALPSFGSTLTKFAGAALAAVAFAAPAHAGTIGFNAEYSMPVGSGDTWTEAGYKLTFEAFDASAVGSAVGSLIDSSDPYPCVDMACPVGGDGMYYGALNDSIVWIESATQGAQFSFKSLDASFIGAFASLGNYPIISGLLRIQGFTADGGYMLQDLLLDGPGATGFEWGTYNFGGAFASTGFVSAALFGFVCDSTGSCDAFGTNQGQFAIDNINLSDLAEVPEPMSAALFGLGALGLLAAARRRQA